MDFSFAESLQPRGFVATASHAARLGVEMKLGPAEIEKQQTIQS
jgi:hypothetical protein